MRRRALLPLPPAFRRLLVRPLQLPGTLRCDLQLDALAVAEASLLPSLSESVRVLESWCVLATPFGCSSVSLVPFRWMRAFCVAEKAVVANRRAFKRLRDARGSISLSRACLATVALFTYWPGSNLLTPRRLCWSSLVCLKLFSVALSLGTEANDFSLHFARPHTSRSTRALKLIRGAIEALRKSGTQDSQWHRQSLVAAISFGENCFMTTVEL